VATCYKIPNSVTSLKQAKSKSSKVKAEEKYAKVSCNAIERQHLSNMFSVLIDVPYSPDVKL